MFSIFRGETYRKGRDGICIYIYIYLDKYQSVTIFHVEY